MRKFRYRAPRFPVDFPVQLKQGESTQSATCKEISTHGMKLELEVPLAPNSLGTVQLSVEDWSLTLPCQATGSEVKRSGIRFLYESEDQLEAMTRLVACITAPKPCTSLVLVGQFPPPALVPTPPTF
jgi:hypothetical protein